MSAPTHVRDSFAHSLSTELDAIDLAALIEETHERPAGLVSAIHDAVETATRRTAVCQLEWADDIESIDAYLFPDPGTVSRAMALPFRPRVLRVSPDGTATLDPTTLEPTTIDLPSIEPDTSIPVRQFVLWLDDRELGGVEEATLAAAMRRCGCTGREVSNRIRDARDRGSIEIVADGVFRAV